MSKYVNMTLDVIRCQNYTGPQKNILFKLLINLLIFYIIFSKWVYGNISIKDNSQSIAEFFQMRLFWVFIIINIH